MHTYLFPEYSLEPHITKSGTILPPVLITWSYHLILPTGHTAWSYLLVLPPGLTNWLYNLVLPPGLTAWSYYLVLYLVLPPGLTVNIFWVNFEKIKNMFWRLMFTGDIQKLFGSFWQSSLWIFFLWVYFWSLHKYILINIRIVKTYLVWTKYFSLKSKGSPTSLKSCSCLSFPTLDTRNVIPVDSVTVKNFKHWAVPISSNSYWFFKTFSQMYQTRNASMKTIETDIWPNFTTQ